MKILLVSWVFLLLGVSINSAHYIRPLEDIHSDFYSVAEDQSGVRFVNSKPAKPTLREILYYHIVERPFGKQEPAVITERSFTNTHGLQFLNDASSASIEPVDDNHEEYEATQHENKLEDEIQNEKEETEPGAEPKPLTDEDVKEAYKHRSYLFDQLRQRYSPVKRMIPDSLSRSKRQADYGEIPSAPEFPESSRDAYIQPNTYGMNLDSDGGYVWNNLNNPPVYYEVGQSTQNPNVGQTESGQSQEILTPEINVPQVTESTDSDSSEDIYVSTDRQPTSQGNIEETPEYVSVVETAEPAENPDSESVVPDTPEPVENPENESAIAEIAPAEIPENESEIPETPVENPNLSLESTDASERPVEPILSDPLPEDNTGDEGPKFENPENPTSDETEKPVEELENGDEPVEIPVEDLETAGESSSEASNGEPMVMPEAPTLPPLNYDGLPGYIRDAISPTERTGLEEQTENPFVNPQLDPEDKKTIEEKMEDIFATAQPVEEIPKTYGMNLTGDSGQVWNDMVNPPVLHNVGTENKEEEPKVPEPSEQENQEQPKPEGQPEVVNPEVEATELPELENPEQNKPEENLEESQPEELPELENPEENLEETQPELENQEGEATELPELENPEQNKPEDNLEESQPEEHPELEIPAGEATIPELENPAEVTELPELENPEENLEETQPELENQEGAATELPELENPEQNKPEENLEESQPVEHPELEIPEGEATIPELENPAEVTELPELENPEENLEETQPELENQEGEATELPELENPEPALNPEEPVETEVGTEIPVEESNPEGEIPNPEEGDTGDEPTESKPDDNKPDIMNELLKSDQFWSWLGEWTATYMELIEKHVRKIAIQEICNHEKSRDMCLLTDSDDTGLTVRDGKIILDGKEIPVTHTSNFDGLRRGNKKEGNKVDATTIYGNSVGNEKVNNIFIFNAVDAKEILEEFKPSNDSKIDFIIDERGQESKEVDNKENVEISDDTKGKIGEIPQDDDIVPPSDDTQTKIDEIAKDDDISKTDEIPKDDDIGKIDEIAKDDDNEEPVLKQEEIDISKDQDAEDKPNSSEMESENITEIPLEK